MMKEIETILRYKWCLSDAPTLITISGILLLRSCARVAGIYRIPRADLYSCILSEWEGRALTKSLRVTKELTRAYTEL